MATLTIRNIHERTHQALRLRAAERGRSVEEEVRRILAEQVNAVPVRRNLRSPEEIAAAVSALRDRFAPPRGAYSVDKFLEDKRKEAVRENRKAKLGK
jgi:plasmid stability protein